MYVAPKGKAVYVSRKNIQPGLSDHYMIECHIAYRSQHLISNNSKNHVWLYDRLDVEGYVGAMSELLSDTQDKVLKGEDIDLVWANFSSKMHQVIDDHVPTKQLKPRKQSQPVWFSPVARRACNKQRKLYTKYKKTGDISVLNRHKIARRENKKLFRELKKSYMVNRLFEPLSQGDSKPFYRYVKELKGNINAIVSMQTNTGQLSNNIYDITDTLNGYFQSVFTPVSASMTFVCIPSP